MPPQAYSMFLAVQSTVSVELPYSVIMPVSVLGEIHLPVHRMHTAELSALREVCLILEIMIRFSSSKIRWYLPEFPLEAVLYTQRII